MTFVSKRGFARHHQFALARASNKSFYKEQASNNTLKRMRRLSKKKHKEIGSLVRELYTKEETKKLHSSKDLQEKPYSSIKKEQIPQPTYTQPTNEKKYAYADTQAIAGQAYVYTYAEAISKSVEKIFEAPALLGRSFFYEWDVLRRRFSASFNPADVRMDVANASQNGPTYYSIQNMYLAAMRALDTLFKGKKYKKI